MSQDNRCYIGVEIGATKLQVALGTAEGRVLKMLREPAEARGGAGAIRTQATQMVCRLCRASEVTAIGVGFGGPVDEEEGRVITSHQVPWWDDVPLATELSEASGKPCVLGNDTNCATLAEALAGAGAGRDPTFYTNVGSGIGGGLYTGGNLYTGRYGGMEIGHTWAHSKLLNRTNRLEDLCSGWAIARRARELFDAGECPELGRLCGNAPSRIDAITVAEAWQENDPGATRLMEDVIDAFARAVCNVIALTNPEIVVVGGGVAMIGEPFFTPLIDSVRKQLLFKAFADNFSLVPEKLGEEAVPVSALLLAARDASLH